MQRHLHRLRHDQAGRALRLQRCRACRPCCTAKAKATCFVAKSWDYHVRVALGCTNEENLEIDPPDASRRREAAGKEVLVDCEHFFDGYKANPGLCAGLRQGGL